MLLSCDLSEEQAKAERKAKKKRFKISMQPTILSRNSERIEIRDKVILKTC